MSELQAATAVFTSLKTAMDIAKAMLGLRDAELMRQKTFELQAIIMAAQESALASNAAQAALVKREGELEAELARMKAWDGEKARYELTEVSSGTFAYAVKSGMENGEPVHKLCANCYHGHRKSILQRENRTPGRNTFLVCHACHNDILVSGHRTA